MPMLFSYDDDDDDDSCKNSQTLPRKLYCQYDIYNRNYDSNFQPMTYIFLLQFFLFEVIH